MIHDLLAADHDRLEALLAAIVHSDGTIDLDSYTPFRGGLLRHIGIEEKILFRALRERGLALPLIDQLHRDHAVLAALLVPPPTAKEIALIRDILTQHNPLEEERGGFYDVIDEIADADLVERVRTFPPVPLAPNTDSDLLRRSIAELLRKSGR